MMAVADAELTGAPGVVLTTKGPGLANAANGMAAPRSNARRSCW